MIKDNFDEYLVDKVLMILIDKYYEKEDEYEFIERIHRTKDIADTIEENNVCSVSLVK